jgi:hypothetical protein
LDVKSEGEGKGTTVLARLPVATNSLPVVPAALGE